MFFIIEITPWGGERFVEGFDDMSDAWDLVSRLRCEARRRRRNVRYDVR